MATDILSIPQIDPSKIEPLQNDLHIGFGGDVAKRLLNARWTDETHATKVFPDNVDRPCPFKKEWWSLINCCTSVH